DEYAQLLVTNWYEQYLHREPDVTGLDTFVTLLQNGNTETAVRAMLLGSAEYYALHGSTAQGFVQGLYQDVLWRVPAGNEANTWIAGAGKPGSVISGFLQSQEFKSDEIHGFY